MAHKPTTTEAAALAYAIGWAKRRYGEKGWAWHPKSECRGGLSWCVIGLREGEHENQWVPCGVGPTWAACMADCVARGG